MKYWGYLAAKLFLAVGLLRSGWLIVHEWGYASVMLLFFLLSFGALYLIVWDQRYRCRTCVRRLRMPVSAGSWTNMFLKGQPRLEYICLYGHGTLRVPEVELTGLRSPNWQPHQDIWTELESIEAGKR